MKMTDDQLLAKEVDIATDEPIKLTIDILPRTKVQELLMKLKLIPKQRIFLLKGATMGTLARISKVAAKIEQKGRKDEYSCQHLAEYADYACEILAIALHNKQAPVPESLIKFLKRNLVTNDIAQLASMVISTLYLEPFMNTILAFGRVNIIKTPQSERSPEAPKEIIASGELLEMHAGIFAGATIV